MRNPATSFVARTLLGLVAVLAADRTAMELLYARRRLAYAEAHLRVDASRPPAESVERLIAWIGY